VPGVFGININGTAQAAAQNEDGSINSSTNPATPGSVVSLFTTGAGAYDREISDGTLGPMKPPFPAPLLGVRAVVRYPFAPIPWKQAEVLFAGQAPGLIAGVVQVNMRIPDNTQPGATTIVVYFGDYPSQQASIYVGR
jgi:uncharacterized protein (TIGR03437 family)